MTEMDKGQTYLIKKIGSLRLIFLNLKMVFQSKK